MQTTKSNLCPQSVCVCVCFHGKTLLFYFMFRLLIYLFRYRRSLLLSVLYDLSTRSLVRPSHAAGSRVAGLQGNLYIRRETGGGAKSFPAGPATSETSFLSLSMIQTRQFSNPHSRAEIQHSLQPAARASLSSPADCAGNFG